MRRFITAFAAFIVLVSGAVAVAAEQPQTIRFGSFGYGYGQPYGIGLIAVAQLKGFVDAEFTDAPVKLEWSYLAGAGPAVNEGIANGQLDFGHYGGLPSIIGRANGLPTRILLSYGSYPLFTVARRDLPITSLKDLKGRRVAVQKGTSLHLALIQKLEENGLTDRDLTLVDLKNPDQLAALAAGSLDAAYGTGVYLPLRDQGVVNVIDKGTGDFGALVVTEAFEKRYPDATARVVRSFVKAAHWAGLAENREEVLRIWAKSGVPYNVVAEEFDGQSLHDDVDPLIDARFIDSYRNGIAFALRQKLIRSDVDLTRWVEPTYLVQALKTLELETNWRARPSETKLSD